MSQSPIEFVSGNNIEMRRIEILLSVLSCFYIPIQGYELPAGIEKCPIMDDECVRNGVSYVLKHHAKSGIKELGLVPLDPLHIKKLNMGKNPNSPVSIDLSFHEVDLVGLHTANVKRVAGFTRDLSKPIDFSMEVPKISLQGPYSVNGKVLILPIVGKGQAQIVLEKCQVNALVKLKSISKGDHRTFAEVADIKLSVIPSHVTYKLEGLFNGQKDLSDNMHGLINENWQEIFNELKGSISEALGLIIKAVLNRTFGKLPQEILFADV